MATAAPDLSNLKACPDKACPDLSGQASHVYHRVPVSRKPRHHSHSLTPESRLTDPDPRDNIVCLSISRTALAHQSGLASLSADLGFAERTAGVLGWREGRSRRGPTQMVKGLLAGMEEECRSAKLKGSQPLVDIITLMSAAHHSRVNGLESNETSF